MPGYGTHRAYYRAYLKDSYRLHLLIYSYLAHLSDRWEMECFAWPLAQILYIRHIRHTKVGLSLPDHEFGHRGGARGRDKDYILSTAVGPYLVELSGSLYYQASTTSS